jgi:hypothetical protein
MGYFRNVFVHSFFLVNHTITADKRQQNADREKKRMLWQEFNKGYGDKIKTFPLEQRMIYELTRKKMVE